MKLYLIALLFLSSSFGKISGYKGYYDCSENDCGPDDDEPNDPRTAYLDLFDSAESIINDTFRLPNFELGLEFYNGYLQTYPFEDYEGGECACPVILKEDKAFVTFHSGFSILTLWYSYKFPFSTDEDGKLQINCYFKYSALLVNETNHAPKFLKVEVTDLNIVNLLPEGVPLKWIFNLPSKYYDLIKDHAIINPVTKLLEEGLLQAFNEGLKKKYNAYQLLGNHDNSVFHFN